MPPWAALLHLAVPLPWPSLDLARSRHYTTPIRLPGPRLSLFHQRSLPLLTAPRGVVVVARLAECEKRLNNNIEQIQGVLVD